MLRRHIATVCLATPSADNPLFHRKKRKEIDIIKNAFIDEKIPLLFPLYKRGLSLCYTYKIFIMFISFFSITMRRERNEPKKEKHVELQQCFALQDRMDDVKIFCHPELVSGS